MDIKCKLKACTASLLLLNTIQLSVSQLHSASPQGNSGPESEQESAWVTKDISPEAQILQRYTEKICSQIERELQKRQELANTSPQDTTQLARTYSQTIAENLAPYKYCQDVDHAVQLSLAIENFQTTVDEFCNSVASTLTSALPALQSATEKLNKFPNNEEYDEVIIPLLCRCYDWENEIQNGLESIKTSVTPLLFEPFLLQSNDPIVKFETLITETDDMQLPMVVYSPAQKTPREKLPCAIWAHGGSIASDLKDNLTLHIESPGQMASPFRLNRFKNNVSIGIQPLARFLASKGIAFVTIEWNAKDGQGNLRQQIKDQIEKIKTLDYIDTDRMTFWGHSMGGYILSLLAANDPQFLRDNFKLGVAFVSPVLNEAWLGGNYDAQPGHQNRDCSFKFALPNDDEHFCSLLIEDKPIGGHSISNLENTEYAKRVLQYVYPFSLTCGMGDDELQSKLASLPPIFILMGTADSNTLPATQGGTLAWRLGNMGLKNWRMLIYKNALHSIHRLGIYLGNPPSTEGFKQMFPDVLQIAQGNPPAGTQDLSELSNGTTLVGDSETRLNPEKRNTMRSYAKRSRFMKSNVNNRPEFIPFGETACGQEILEAMRANDE
ncbi:MAG: S9 family peptidase [Holosporaceae bacterium]|jgi:acetyl esterase/lipase|nr:S9 family peptidase [Holosporaceae bacterium]